jgi:protein ImuA
MPAVSKLADLQRQIESLERSGSSPLSAPRLEGPQLAFGHPSIDAHFSAGGLAWGVHQFASPAGDPAASRAFSLMLLARRLASGAARCLILQEASAHREAGAFYGPGLKALGVDPDRVVFVAAPDGREGLRAIYDALAVRAFDILIADLCDDAGLADLSVTRRFNLSALRGRALVFLTTPDLSATSAALTRWRVASAPSSTSKRHLGGPVLELDLVRNRHGRPGRWVLEWNSHDLRFQSPASGQGRISVAPTLAASVAA